jgi:hypothetical protein
MVLRHTPSSCSRLAKLAAGEAKMGTAAGCRFKRPSSALEVSLCRRRRRRRAAYKKQVSKPAKKQLNRSRMDKSMSLPQCS